MQTEVGRGRLLLCRHPPQRTPEALADDFRKRPGTSFHLGWIELPIAHPHPVLAVSTVLDPWLFSWNLEMSNELLRRHDIKPPDIDFRRELSEASDHLPKLSLVLREEDDPGKSRSKAIKRVANLGLLHSRGHRDLASNGLLSMIKGKID